MCWHRDGEGNQKPNEPVLFWLEPSWKLIFILSINKTKFHLNRAPKPIYVVGFRRPFSAAFRSFLSTWKTVQAQKAPPSNLWSFFFFISLKKCTRSHFYIHCGISQQWMCGYEPPKSTKNPPWEEQQASLPPSPFNCSDQSWLLQEPFANSKTHQHIFNIYPAKRRYWTNSKCKKWREDEKPNTTNQELALMSHVWTGELSAFQVRQQLIQAARNSYVPPWQGLSKPPKSSMLCRFRKMLVSPITFKLVPKRQLCRKIKSWGYSESHWTQYNNTVLLVKPKSLCLNRTALCKACTVIPVRQHCWDQSWNAASSWWAGFQDEINP